MNKEYLKNYENFFITGGAGFIGSSLCDVLLKENKKVIVLDNFNNYYSQKIKEDNIRTNLSNSNYKLYRGDICNKEDLCKVFSENKIDAVIHMAAVGGVRHSIENPLEYVHNNIYGTTNLLEQMKLSGIKKLIFASSSSVYGDCSSEKFSEDLEALKPISPYAATKLACEQMIYTYSLLYGIKSVCLRFFTVYGPRQRPDLAICKFINLINSDKPLPVYGDGSSMRDYTYVDDIIRGVIAAIDYDKTFYEIINLGGGVPITLTNLIKTIEKILGKSANLEYLSAQSGDVFKTVSDISKARKLLNYNPTVSLDEGIKMFCEWQKSNFRA